MIKKTALLALLALAVIQAMDTPTPKEEVNQQSKKMFPKTIDFPKPICNPLPSEYSAEYIGKVLTSPSNNRIFVKVSDTHAARIYGFAMPKNLDNSWASSAEVSYEQEKEKSFVFNVKFGRHMYSSTTNIYENIFSDHTLELEKVLWPVQHESFYEKDGVNFRKVFQLILQKASYGNYHNFQDASCGQKDNKVKYTIMDTWTPEDN